MWQVLHILKKDTRYLAKELCLMMALVIMFAWTETHIPVTGWPETLLSIGVSFLIARVIHTEAIPGQNQFWLTRPYQWKSLLASKIFFLLFFISLPVLFAQAYIALAVGFSLKSILPGLLFSQGLIFLVIILPMAALAATTAGLVPYLFSFLLLLVVEFILVENVFLIGFRPALPNQGPAQWPGETEWLRNFIVGSLLAFAAALVLYIQYKSRRTRFSHLLGISLLLTAGLLYFHMPALLGFQFETLFNKQQPGNGSLLITFNPTRRKQFPLHGRNPVTEVEAIVPLELTNLPSGNEIHVDALYVTLQGTQGQTWNAGATTFNQISYRAEPTVLYDLLKIDSSFVRKINDQSITLHGSLYFTYLENSTSATIPIQNKPVSATEQLQCRIQIFNQFYCKSAFGWPRALVQAQFEQGQKEDFVPTFSYSPVPAALRFHPVEAHWVSAPPESKQVTITLKKPVAHLHKNFEIRDVNLQAIRNQS